MDHAINSRFMFDDDAQDAARICVMGVGGGGGNAVNNMIDKGIQDVEFQFAPSRCVKVRLETAGSALISGRVSAGELGEVLEYRRREAG